MSRIAFLGLGAMGSRMVVHLIKAGHAVIVWNRTPQAAEPIVALGATSAQTPREAAAQADLVFSMVTDDKASESVWTMAGTGALEGIDERTAVVEMSTVSPGWIKKLAAAVAARDASFLDAPVSGSLPQAEAGKLAIFVGGDQQVFLRARPVLEPMGSAVHHIGPVGAGLSMKLAVNALLAIQVSALAEAISTLEKSGIAAGPAFNILSTLATASPAANWIGGLMVTDDYAPRFPISLVAKDLRYQAENTRLLGGESPILNSALTIYEHLREAGFGDENISAAIRAYR